MVLAKRIWFTLTHNARVVVVVASVAVGEADCGLNHVVFDSFF